MTQATLPSSAPSLLPPPAGAISLPASGSIPSGIAQSASSLAPARQPARLTLVPEEEKGLAERAANCCLESFAIVKDFFLMIFHFLTFNCFKSAQAPVPSYLLPQAASSYLSPAEHFTFLEKRESVVSQIAVHKTFEDGFFLLFKEYPQPQIRQMLLGDFEMYIVKRVSIQYGLEMRAIGTSYAGYAALAKLPFNHKIAPDAGTASDQLKSFANTSSFYAAFLDFSAQLYLKNRLTGSAVTSPELKDLIKTYCEIVVGS